MMDRWEQISEIYNAALELQESERPAFLAVSVPDEDMRKEIESLLDSGRTSEDMLERPAFEVVAKRMARVLPLSIVGKQFGHYRVTSLLSAGGMGEVYEAEDLQLGRKVAIKILPEEFAADEDRVARFQREATLLAALNHPNIAAIYGLEMAEGTPFLVLELVGGETLADRLKRGPISLRESLKLAIQIADALEAAHEKGIIHLDLKPANIKVTSDEEVKVLDFGMAKALAGGPHDLVSSRYPTGADAASQQEAIMGTVAYMSPEQTRGRILDTRSDVWAFGVVLYEMLVGSPLFGAETISETLAAVLTKDIDWEGIPAEVYPVLHRCLQKDPNNRLRDIGDVKLELEEVLAGLNNDGVKHTPESKARTDRRWILKWVVAAIVLGTIALIIARYSQRSVTSPIISYQHMLRDDQVFADLLECEIAISRDGKQIAYATSDGLYLRSMDEPNARLIPRTGRNPMRPFFSPDGRWIGYSQDDELKKIAVSGGEVVSIGGGVPTGSYSWATDGSILYAVNGRGIMKIPPGQEVPELVIKEEKGTIISPQMLPDRDSVIFTYCNSKKCRIVLQSIKSRKRKELLDEGIQACYLSTGHLVYGIENNLYAVRFNLRTLEVGSAPVLIVEHVYQTLGVPQYAVSESGNLVYVPMPSAGVPAPRTLVWVDPHGAEEPIAIEPDDYRGLRISPDGTRVALVVQNKNHADIWIWNFVRKSREKLTPSSEDNNTPIWTPDSKYIVFSSNRQDSFVIMNSIYRKPAEGMGKAELVAEVPKRSIFPWSWSNDGKTLVFLEYSMLGNFDIGSVSIEGASKWSLLWNGNHVESQPQVSADGHWLAYVSGEFGRQEVCVRPFPEVDKGWCQISSGGGNSPLWSPDGLELYYRNGDSVIAVALRTMPMFKKLAERVLFRGDYVACDIRPGVINPNPWDISPDGKRFLMIKSTLPSSSSSTAPRTIEVVVSWFARLKQLAPAH